jgi:hypothetical protein
MRHLNKRGHSNARNVSTRRAFLCRAGLGVTALAGGPFTWGVAAKEQAQLFQRAQRYLQQQSKRLLDGCRITAEDGTTLYTPDGEGNYYSSVVSLNRA